ncbi:MAG: hypothetical protein MUE96_05025 [Bacteroidia bacterium]|jgi:outer membrane protein W|nr:hypothetical protein [Bacteroidia bacterium]
MKKTILSLAMVAMGVAAFAQKPAAGDKTIETSLLFQTGTAPISLFTPNLRARYFIADGLAARVEFVFESDKTTTNFTENADGTGGKGSAVAKSSSFTFAPGIEKHFAGTEKFSPYVGATIPLVFAGASEEWENSANGTTYTQGVNATIDGATSGGIRAGSSIGVNLVLGADYYFTDAIYLGAEIQWGWATSTDKESTTTVKVPNTPDAKTVTPEAKASGFGIATSGIRLGWKF